jgi:hypothetical protein
MKRSHDDLHAFLMACGLRFEGVPGLPFERPGYVRATTRRELTDDERAMLAELDAQLLAQRPCPVPVTTAEEWFADYAERHAHEATATRPLAGFGKDGERRMKAHRRRRRRSTDPRA